MSAKSEMRKSPMYHEFPRHPFAGEDPEEIRKRRKLGKDVDEIQDEESDNKPRGKFKKPKK